MPSGVYNHCKIRKVSKIKDWDQYKDLEYYPNHFCHCLCHGRIKVRSYHRLYGIPNYIAGHHRRGEPSPRKGKSSSRKGKTYEEIYGEEKAAEMKEKMGGMRRGRKLSEEAKKNMKGHSGVYLKSEEHKEKLRKSSKRNWQDLEFVAKQMRGQCVKPNKPEKQLNKLLQKLFPNQWKFVGDGQLILAGKCPDFINVNGQKKIIEHFGDYWHGEEKTGVSNEEHEQERMNLFAQYGYQTLIIWQHELENIEKLTEKVLSFNSKIK